MERLSSLPAELFLKSPGVCLGAGMWISRGQSAFGESFPCCCLGWVLPLSVHTTSEAVLLLDVISVLCGGNIPASPGCPRTGVNTWMEGNCFSESSLNGIFIANVRRVFLLGGNTGKHTLRSHLFIILNCSALLGKSILPFNIESPGQVAPGESPWKEHSFGEAAAGRNEGRLSAALRLACRSCS